MRMFQALHKYYDDCFSDGKFDRDKVIRNDLIDNNYSTDERLNLLEKVYKIVLEAKFLNEFTIDYLTHSNRNYDDIIKKYNENRETPLDINSGRSRITFCQRKIAEVFTTVSYDGEELNFITWLFKTKAHMGVNLDPAKIDLRNEFVRQFNRFNDMYGEVIDINKKDMLITIPTYDKVSELSEEKFDDFMDIIQPYSKYMLSIMQSEINNLVEEVGYFRFLMSKSSKLNDIDRERKATILRWLGKENVDNEELIENNVTDDEDNVEDNGIEDSGEVREDSGEVREEVDNTDDILLDDDDIIDDTIDNEDSIEDKEVDNNSSVKRGFFDFSYDNGDNEEVSKKDDNDLDYGSGSKKYGDINDIFG